MLGAGGTIADYHGEISDALEPLTTKPMVIVENGPGGIDLLLESELGELPEEEAAAFRDGASALEEVAERLKESLGLITFFTIGPTEARAWTLRGGRTALEAAGEIHTDIARGFIRCEVIAWGDLVDAGTRAEVKKRGWNGWRKRDCRRPEGDVLNIRFNVPAAGETAGFPRVPPSQRGRVHTGSSYAAAKPRLRRRSLGWRSALFCRDQLPPQHRQPGKSARCLGGLPQGSPGRGLSARSRACAMRQVPCPASTSGRRWAVSRSRSSSSRAWFIASSSVGIFGLPAMWTNVSQRPIERPDLGVELEVDREEPDPFAGRDEVALVEVEHGVALGLEPVEQRAELRSDLGDGRDVVPAEAVGRVRAGEPVDRLVEGDPAAGSQDAEELRKRLLLVLHVDEHGPRRDDVDRLALDGREVVGRRADEPAAVAHAERLGRLAAEVEQVLRDVAEDHGRVGPHTPKRSALPQPTSTASRPERGRPVERRPAPGAGDDLALHLLVPPKRRVASQRDQRSRCGSGFPPARELPSRPVRAGRGADGVEVERGELVGRRLGSSTNSHRLAEALAGHKRVAADDRRSSPVGTWPG